MRRTKTRKHIKTKKVKSHKHIKTRKHIRHKHIRPRSHRSNTHKGKKGKGMLLFMVPEKKQELTILLNQNGQGQQDINMIPGLRKL